MDLRPLRALLEKVIGSPLSVEGLRDALKYADLNGAHEEWSIADTSLRWSLKHFRGVLEERPELIGKAIGHPLRKTLISQIDEFYKKSDELKKLAKEIADAEAKLVGFAKEGK